jgi:hypothetical protein
VAKILICVHPDGTWTTSINYCCAIQAAAEQPAGVITYASEPGDFVTIGRDLSRFIAGSGTAESGGQYVGDWRKWRAFCVNKWGVWFDRVECEARRARLPSPDEKVEQRALGIITRSGDILLSVLRNRMREESPEAIRRALTRLADAGAISVISDEKGTAATIIRVK